MKFTMIKNILFTLKARITVTLVSFAMIILTSRYLGAEGRGVLVLLTTSAGLVNLLSGFIGGAALVYLIPKNKNRNFLIHAVVFSYIWSVFASVSVTFILIFTKSIPQDIVLHVFFIGILIAILNTNTIILVGFEKIFYQNLVNLLQIIMILFIFSGLIFILHKVNINSYIEALYVSYIIAILLSFAFILRNVPRKNGEVSFLLSIKEILKYGFISQLGNVIQYLNYRFSYYILNYFFSVSSVGIYSVGVAISEAVWMISGSISLIQYSRIANSNDIYYSRQITIKLAKYSFMVTLFAICFLILFPKGLFSFIFGKDFGSVKEIIIYLSPGILIFSYTVIISHYFAGIGKYMINTKAALLGLIITLIFSFLLVPKYNYIGAAIVSSLSYITTGSYLVYSFMKEASIGFKKLIPSVNDIKFAISKAKNRS